MSARIEEEFIPSLAEFGFLTYYNPGVDRIVRRQCGKLGYRTYASEHMTSNDVDIVSQ